MKEKFLIISLYILLALIACVVGAYWLFVFAFDDILSYYYGGILKYVFILIMLAGIILPVMKYRKYKEKWILPIVLSLMVCVTPIFNNGILKIVEDDLRIYSEEKWERHKELRIYMLDDLENRYLYKGRTESYVKNLLGEPDIVGGENSQCYEYFASPGFVDPIIFYVKFEDGLIVDTGQYHS